MQSCFVPILDDEVARHVWICSTSSTRPFVKFCPYCGRNLTVSDPCEAWPIPIEADSDEYDSGEEVFQSGEEEISPAEEEGGRKAEKSDPGGHDFDWGPSCPGC